MKATKLWAGFTDGRLYLSSDEHGYVTAPLFKTEKQARSRFEDVRIVEVRELQNQRKGK
jgi:hypothetical protein